MSEYNECGQCRWWNRHEPRGDQWENANITMGECHGAPPTADIDVSRLNPNGWGDGYWTIHYHQGYFPTTSEDDDCAQFRPREEK